MATRSESGGSTQHDLRAIFIMTRGTRNAALKRWGDVAVTATMRVTRMSAIIRVAVQKSRREKTYRVDLIPSVVSSIARNDDDDKISTLAPFLFVSRCAYSLLRKNKGLLPTNGTSTRCNTPKLFHRNRIYIFLRVWLYRHGSRPAGTAEGGG
jgi:hypothetical protein